MPDEVRAPPARAGGVRLWARIEPRLLAIFLVAGLLLGAGAYHAAARSGNAAQQAAFQRVVERSTDAFQAQLDRIELALNAVHGLHTDSRVTTRSYRAFVEQLADGQPLSASFDGIEAVGFAHERDGLIAFQMVEPDGVSLSFADVRRHPELTDGLWRSAERPGTSVVPLSPGLPGSSALVAPLLGDEPGGVQLQGWSVVFVDEQEILELATRGEPVLATVRSVAAAPLPARVPENSWAAAAEPGAGTSSRVVLDDHAWELAFSPVEETVGEWLVRRQPALSSGIGVTIIVWLMGWAIRNQQRGRRRAEVAVASATASLREQEQRFRTLAAASPTGIFLTDPTGRVTYTNQRLATILKASTEQLLDDGLWTYLQPDVAARARLLDRLAADADGSVRCVPVTDGPDQVLSLRATALVDGDGHVTGYTGTAEDITDQVAAHEQLAEREAANRALAERFAHQARHDALTGIPNRVELLERLAGLSEQDVERTALLLLDLDGFKVVNDTLGHAAGDDLLVAISARLTSALRDDDLLVRLGGDEFAILTSGGREPQAALGLADRLLETVQRPIDLGTERVKVGGSIGVAVWSAGATDPEELLQQADLAMYAAKEAGRGRVELFAPALGTATQQRHTLERALREALDEDRLTAAFQPVVDVATGRIVGVETLARWEHPTLGTVSPAAFIPIAEQAGLIPQLGTRICHQALRAARRWWADHRIQTGVNVSVRELTEPGYAARLLRDIEEHGLPPEAVVVEVTESQLATSSAAGQALGTLRAHGIEVAIDDFGAGYSSLARLRTLPADVLKIDRSFTVALDEPAGRSVVEAIVQLGETIGCQLVAEGVETEEQAAVLADVGCHLAQGYLLYAPMSASQVDEVLRASHAEDRRLLMEAVG